MEVEETREAWNEKAGGKNAEKKAGEREYLPRARAGQALLLL